MPSRALKDLVLPMVLNAGLDTGKDPKVEHQGFLRLENSLYRQQGELSKRHGITTLASSIDEDYVADHGGIPTVYGHGAIRQKEGTSLETDSSGYWELNLFDVDIDTWEDSIYSGHGHTIKYQQVLDDDTNNLRMIAYQSLNNITAQGYYALIVIESRTGRIIARAANSVGRYVLIPRAAGGAYYALLVDEGGSTYYVHKGTISSAGAIGAAARITGSSQSGGAVYACLIDATNDHFLVVHTTSAAALEYLVCVTGGSTVHVTAGPAATIPRGCYRQSDTVAVAIYQDGAAAAGNVKSRGIGTDGSFTAAEATMYTWAVNTVVLGVCGIATGANTGTIYMGLVLSSGLDTTEINNAWTQKNTYNSSTGAAGSTTDWHRGLIPYSYPFEDSDGDHYLAMQSQGLTSGVNRFALIVKDDGKVCAHFLPGFIDAYDINALDPTIVQDKTDEFVFAAVKHVDEVTSTLAICTATRGAPDGIQALTIQRQLTIPNSCPMQFDGQIVAEQGFLHFPRTITVTMAGSGGSLPAGQFGYCAVYEWLDAYGHKHKSSPSLPVSATSAGSDEATIVVPCYTPYSLKAALVTIVLYRTDTDGSIYYRLDEAKSQYQESVSFTDDGSVDPTSNEQLYTTGGVLANECPPPYRVHCIHQERQFVVNREEEDWDIRYSKQFIAGEGISHTGLLTIRCSPDGGRITALASHLDRLIIFKANRIYATHGQGLDRLGTGQGYATPLLISEAIGCANKRTIVRVPQGLMFEGTDGIYLLDKSLQVVPIGDPVKYHFEQVTLVAGTIIPERHFAIWVSSGLALVYDYLHGQWSTFTNHAATDICESGGIYYLMTTGGTVKYEDTGTYIDDSTSVLQLIQTGWLSFAKALGVQYVREVLLGGQSISNHSLTLETAYDGEPYFVDSQTFAHDAGSIHYPSSAAYGAGSSGYEDKGYILAAGLSRIETTKLMLRITEVGPAEGNLGQGFTLSEIAFAVAVEEGLKRQGSSRRF